jgi:hypothetical protein
MLRAIAVGLVILASVSDVHASPADREPYSDPVVAMPITPALLDNESALACFSQLLALGGYGQRPDERAAFLVLREPDSLTFSCALWPARHTFRQEQWSGTIPQGAVAILHTHPEVSPDPSSHDVSEAHRIGIPILAITPGAIEMVEPRDGRIIVLLRERGWWRRSATPPKPGG